MANNVWWAPAIVLFTRISAIIALPAIIILVVSNFVKMETLTEKIIFFSISFFSFILSMYLVIKIIKNNFKDSNVGNSGSPK